MDEQITGFNEAIWEWYATHKRTLPWRDMDISDDTERAYRVMVSEVMLQQTQVSRVIILFRNFLERFGSIKTLADASNADVIMAWRGMGYNSRALRLRDAARSVVENHNGVFPSNYDQLLSINGLGPYTAAAIRNFAFNIPTPCIDTNIRRILHRTFVGPEDADGRYQMADKHLLVIAQNVLDAALIAKDSQLKANNPQPRRSAADWHAALMDYGSLVQTKTSPKWDQCILTERGLMKTSQAQFEQMLQERSQLKAQSPQLREPGRFVGSRYIPNRIFRGKIVEALRDAQEGLSEEEIGRQICIDWNPELRPWLNQLVKKLVRDKLLKEGINTYSLHN
jgi:A/G-specific adenine glycosylase